MDPLASGSEAEPADMAVVMRGVVRRVAGRRGSSGALLLDRIDLRVPRGTLLHVVGPSGAGKSSLIRLINRLDEATAGSIEVLGRPVQRWSPRELRQRAAMVFQEPTLLGMTVRGNIELAMELAGGASNTKGRIEQLLNLADVDADLVDRGSQSLSVGQKLRVALVRALAGDPDLLLLDEPTSALDGPTAAALLRRIVNLRQQRDLTIVLTTHRLAEARMLGGTMLVLIDGRVAAVDDVEHLMSSPPSGPAGDFIRATPT
jgi:ABC-type methionine transport system ATPase subunit